MNMFKRILVAVDQSKPAEHAIEVTVALATALRASVSVVHVVDSNAAFVSEAAAMDQITLGAMRRDGWRALENAFGRIPPFLRPERVFLEGDPAECIVAMVPHAGQLWFFKMTGSADPVGAQKDNFKNFVSSVQFAP